MKIMLVELCLVVLCIEMHLGDVLFLIGIIKLPGLHDCMLNH